MIRLILILTLIYLVIRLVGRALFPPAAGHYKRKSTEKGEKEGDVTIQAKKNGAGKKISKDEGDYVDFEEMK